METESIAIYDELVKAIKDLAGHAYIYFDRGIHAKTTTFCAAFEMWGVCVSPDNMIYVMDSSNQWHIVEDRPEDQRILLRLYKYFHLNETQSFQLFNHL